MFSLGELCCSACTPALRCLRSLCALKLRGESRSQAACRPSLHKRWRPRRRRRPHRLRRREDLEKVPHPASARRRCSCCAPPQRRRADLPLPLSPQNPILQQWEWNADGSLSGRVYGKSGFREGENMNTLVVPPENRFDGYVITGSGSIYRLGERLVKPHARAPRRALGNPASQRPLASRPPHCPPPSGTPRATLAPMCRHTALHTPGPRVAALFFRLLPSRPPAPPAKA